MAKSKWYLENEQKIADVKRMLQEATMSNTIIESGSLLGTKDVLQILMNRVAYLESIIPEDKRL